MYACEHSNLHSIAKPAAACKESMDVQKGMPHNARCTSGVQEGAAQRVQPTANSAASGRANILGCHRSTSEGTRGSQSTGTRRGLTATAHGNRSSTQQCRRIVSIMLLGAEYQTPIDSCDVCRWPPCLRQDISSWTNHRTGEYPVAVPRCDLE